MSTLSYAIVALLCRVLACVPIGTNYGIFALFWALLSGRFLSSRGAVFPALAAMGLGDAAVCRAEAALAHGRFQTSEMVSNWQTLVREQGHWQPHNYEGICPVACDLTGFFRPRLRDCTTKHYTAQAGKALPALVYGLCVEVGSIGTMRLGVPRLLLRQQAGETEPNLQSRLVSEVAAGLASNQALIMDAGFGLSDVRAHEGLHFVVRMAQNSTARRNERPTYSGKGRPPEYGGIVRPLPRTYGPRRIEATKPDATVHWKDGRHTIQAHLYENLVTSEEKPGGMSFRLVVIFDPRYPKPLMVATNLTITLQAIWQLYRDRWPVEQLPLAAKQILGTHRSFVFSDEARYRLPELALLAGNFLSYVAASAPAVPTGFWDRCCRPTCGRLRRYLERLNFSELSLSEARFRKKASNTDHLPKGVLAHRRHKAHLHRSTSARAA